MARWGHLPCWKHCVSRDVPFNTDGPIMFIISWFAHWTISTHYIRQGACLCVHTHTHTLKNDERARPLCVGHVGIFNRIPQNLETAPPALVSGKQAGRRGTQAGVVLEVPSCEATSPGMTPYSVPLSSCQSRPTWLAQHCAG